jgi:hypothetical protein
MKKKHQTQRTNTEQLRDLFKQFNTTYKETFLIVKPANQTKNER